MSGGFPNCKYFSEVYFPRCIFPKCFFSKMYFSKVYFFEVYFPHVYLGMAIVILGYFNQNRKVLLTYIVVLLSRVFLCHIGQIHTGDICFQVPELCEDLLSSVDTSLKIARDKTVSTNLTSIDCDHYE